MNNDAYACKRIIQITSKHTDAGFPNKKIKRLAQSKHQDKRNPDFDYACLTDKDGKEIKGKAGKLPPEDQAILEAVLCKKALASAPAHKIG